MITCLDEFTALILDLFLLFVFVLSLNVPVNTFFSHVGTEPTLPGFNQYSRELCLAQRTQHGDAMTSRFRVRRPTTTAPRSLDLSRTSVSYLKWSKSIV